ncbi:carbohydrate binding family 9 domain-containing protein [Pseudoflavitalea sp. G-6-1-2]|uniref:DUF5916 domain-containing protein n=1 Tax=Pseudoflavitalea sp. G-6-1-2 TaxID=2728841 RepID=UPI00146C0036|nr:DUF5916 domain-containing protein [Pseudoflavitalea sp. G-6-1-2]NML22786.1 carbohydrate binding family 9 domain-containing protein [Pseudoflavitalea sp. G-6-1-2]
MRIVLTAMLFISCGGSYLSAQEIPSLPAEKGPQQKAKRTQTARATGSIRIDGTLDEADWANAPVSTDFITNGPVYGLPASSKTEVRVLHDNTAIYIGAYLYDDPAAVRRQFTARDNEQRADVDYFSVFLDTYNDHQNAFQFLVTARNVQSDARVSPNASTGFGVYGDLSWDAVWDSKVSFENDRWVVEMKIPFFAIRFPSKNLQEWGIQFLRFSRRNNESTFWNPVNPNVTGFVLQFGQLEGLHDILPPLRLSFSPYVSAGYRSTPEPDTKNNREILKSGGMDLKYGISEGFTLDATLIPDFGQVRSDDVVNNLTPFEIQFRENRPFFTEGTELFNKAGIFYSRRIGKTPSRYQEVRMNARYGDYPDYELRKNPSVTRVYNAVKFSGRTDGNLGIGIFNSVTEPVRARLRHRFTGEDSIITTEPLTNYNVIVLDQALKNRSYITFTNTNVWRQGYYRDANVSALDIALYDKKNEYGLVLKPRYSMIFNKKGGYQGFSNYAEFGKVSGKLQFSVSNELLTAKYDPNDLGFLTAPNRFINKGSVSYNIYEESKWFINQSYGISSEYGFLLQPFSYQKFRMEAFGFWLFKNFWDLRLNADIVPGWYNDFFEMQTPEDLLETPRQPLKKAPYYSLSVDGSSDSRKRLYVSWSLGFAEGPLPNDPYHKIELNARYRFSDRLSVTGSFFKQYDHGQFGYAFFRDKSNDAPVLARRRYAEITTELSSIYNFTPRMNITFRARHFWNKLNNTNLYNIKEDGYWTERTDLDPSEYNVNYNVFNLDVFFTWDFRLGSRIVAGWKNWLGRDFEDAIDGSRYRRYPNNLSKVFATPHGNELTLRFIYFLNYEQLRKRK